MLRGMWCNCLIESTVSRSKVKGHTAMSDETVLLFSLMTVCSVLFSRFFSYYCLLCMCILHVRLYVCLSVIYAFSQFCRILIIIILVIQTVARCNDSSHDSDLQLTLVRKVWVNYVRRQVFRQCHSPLSAFCRHSHAGHTVRPSVLTRQVCLPSGFGACMA